MDTWDSIVPVWYFPVLSILYHGTTVYRMDTWVSIVTVWYCTMVQRYRLNTWDSVVPSDIVLWYNYEVRMDTWDGPTLYHRDPRYIGMRWTLRQDKVGMTNVLV